MPAPKKSRPWIREPFVLDGYRDSCSSVADCLRSVLGAHNQTGDIWTHLAAFVTFGALGLQALAWEGGTLYALPTSEKLWFAVFLAGTLNCFLSSTLYHVFNPISPAIHGALLALDFFGILTAFVGSFLFLSHYGFACAPRLRVFYLSLHTVLAVIFTRIISMPGFGKHENKKRRLRLLLALFSSGLVCLMHLGLEHGIFSEPARFLFWRPLYTYGVYGVGVVFYATRFPESSYPGRFDYLLKSHQLWHVSIIVGAYNFFGLCVECVLWGAHRPCP